MLTGQDRRDALRAAIKASEKWPAYRDLIGKNVAELTMGEMGEAFAALYPDWTLEQWAESSLNGRLWSHRPSPAQPLPSAMPPAENAPAESGVDSDTLALAKLLSGMKGKADLDESRVVELIKTHGGTPSREIVAMIEELAAKLDKATIPVRVELIQGELARPVEGLAHKQFATLIKVLASRMANGVAPNVWIAGPTGSGKTHACDMAARALGLRFFFNGALAMPHEMVGFVDAAGHYHTTPFREAFENGGVYLFDECDASDAAVLLTLNAALANGVMSFPDSPNPIARHKDFICIAAANTFGQGATAEFIGRSKLDAAFLSRFPVKLFWEYDLALEQAFSGNPGFAKQVQAARERARVAGVKIVIDPRHSAAGAALIAAGFTEREAAGMTYLAGLSPDQRHIVAG